MVRTQRRSPENWRLLSPSTQEHRPTSRAARSTSTVFDPAYAALAGAHRIQRVPDTEKRGRRHSSEVTVVVLDENTARHSGAVKLRTDDVRIDFFRSSGAGGQHRNKVESCARAVHLPTGLTALGTESRSQRQNKEKALTRLMALLEERANMDRHDATNAFRREALDQFRTWTWTGWRDEVKRPDGRKVRMTAALRGRLGPLLDLDG